MHLIFGGVFPLCFVQSYYYYYYFSYFCTHSTEELLKMSGLVWSPGKRSDCTIMMTDADLVDLMTGKLNPQTVSWPRSL